MSKLMSFIKKEEGQGMVEYGLIVVGIALVVAAVLALMGPQISALFTHMF